jgi:hypothetical protein
MRDILLGNSIVRGMEGREWETIVLPGIDWNDAAYWIMENIHLLRDSTIYIHVGPVPFSKKAFIGSVRQYTLERSSHNLDDIFSVCLNAAPR